MDVLIGVLSLFFLLAVTFGVIVAVRVTRAVQRGVEHTATQIRRTVGETTLRAKGAQPGPLGELARRRLELRSSIDGTRRALEAGVGRDPSLREAIGLLDRLHEHARHLDDEMRLLMEREPERSRTQARLPEIRERVARIKESADSLRFAAQDRARGYDAEGLSALEDQIQIESGALRHWEREERHSGGPGDRPARSDGRERPDRRGQEPSGQGQTGQRHAGQERGGQEQSGQQQGGHEPGGHEHAGHGHAGRGADQLGPGREQSGSPVHASGPQGDQGGSGPGRSQVPHLRKGRPRTS